MPPRYTTIITTITTSVNAFPLTPILVVNIAKTRVQLLALRAFHVRCTSNRISISFLPFLCLRFYFYFPLSTQKRILFCSLPAHFGGMRIPTIYSCLIYQPILLTTLSTALIEWPLQKFHHAVLLWHIQTYPHPQADISIVPLSIHDYIHSTKSSPNPFTHFQDHSNISFGRRTRQTPCVWPPKEMPKRGGTLAVSLNVGAIGVGDFSPSLTCYCSNWKS